MIKRTPLEYIVQQVEHGVGKVVRKMMIDGVAYVATGYRPLDLRLKKSPIRIDLAKQGEA